MTEETEDLVMCPLCEKQFAGTDDLSQHLRGKPGHMRVLIAEFTSMKNEIATLKDAIIAWRELAQSRKR